MTPTTTIALGAALGLLSCSDLARPAAGPSQPDLRRSEGGDASTLDEQEQADLAYMREEEKLARDVYLALYAEHRLKVHKQISKSEQRHMDAMEDLLEHYGLEDPVTDDSVGAFTDPHLAELHAELVAWGLASEVDALKVGATIEDLDMVDIVAAMDNSDEAHIDDTYASLLCGSRNHLRAFVDVLATYGETYTATFMDPEEMEAILEAPHERCG